MEILSIHLVKLNYLDSFRLDSQVLQKHRCLEVLQQHWKNQHLTGQGGRQSTGLVSHLLACANSIHYSFIAETFTCTSRSNTGSITRALLQQQLEARQEQENVFSNGSECFWAGKYPMPFQSAFIALACFAKQCHCHHQWQE